MSEEKSVAELAAELDGLVDIPEKVEEEPKVEEQPKQKKKPEPPKQPVPKQEDPPPLPTPTPEPAQTQTEETPSFDSAIKNILDDNDKQIEANAIEAKKKFRKTINMGLAKLIEMAAEGKFDMPTELPHEPEPSPIIEEQQPMVDNSEAIRSIDLKLTDPNYVGPPSKMALLSQKRFLQGRPLSEEDLKVFAPSPVSIKKSGQQKQTGFFSPRRLAALAIFLVAVAVIVIGLI